MLHYSLSVNITIFMRVSFVYEHNAHCSYSISNGNIIIFISTYTNNNDSNNIA